MTSTIITMEKKICERCNIEFNLLDYIDHTCMSDND